jgi:DNA-binding beta-propeller fold protein YncE
MYIVANVLESLSADGRSMTLSGRVSAIDLATQAELWSVETAQGPDAALSYDGTRLFIATRGPGELWALDTRSGQEVWRVPLEQLVGYKFYGPPTLAVSEDGSRLYAYSYDVDAGTGDSRTVPFRVQVFDTATGEHITDTEPWTDGCDGQPHVSKYGPTLVVACRGSGQLFLVDLNTGKRLDNLWVGGPTRGSVLSPDGCFLYVVDEAGAVAVVDVEQRQVVRQGALDLAALDLEVVPQVVQELVALSPDGTTLYAGVQTTPISSGGTWQAEVLAFDTETWQHAAPLDGDPIFGYTLAVSRAGDALFGVEQAFRFQSSIPESATIVTIAPSDSSFSALELTLEGADVLRILTGP